MGKAFSANLSIHGLIETVSIIDQKLLLEDELSKKVFAPEVIKEEALAIFEESVQKPKGLSALIKDVDAQIEEDERIKAERRSLFNNPKQD